MPTSGHAIIATFAPSGPEKRGGLAVHRYDAGGLAVQFGAAFELVASEAERRTAPWGRHQNFT